MAFTADWFSHNIPKWQEILSPLVGLPIKALEIGCFEGMATKWLLQNILTHDDAVITCVDTFAGSAEHEDGGPAAMSFSNVEENFNINVHAPFRGKVKKIKDTSFAALTAFNSGYEVDQFDLIYIDGSHTAQDVLTDALLAWPLVKLHGIVIFDDYEWHGFPEPHKNPKLGIDSFLGVIAGQFEVIEKGYQVAIKKIEHK